MNYNNTFFRPGRYGHYTPKKIAFEYSFGGKRKLKDVVVMKCNNGIFEIVIGFYNISTTNILSYCTF